MLHCLYATTVLHLNFLLVCFVIPRFHPFFHVLYTIMYLISEKIWNFNNGCIFLVYLKYPDLNMLVRVSVSCV